MLKKIKQTIASEEFSADLKDYLYYASNIKFEKFIAYSLNKSFLKAGLSSTLEKKKVDITTNGVNIELKFHFDFDIINRLKIELEQHPAKLDKLFKKYLRSKKSNSWSIAYGVLKDILGKKCDVFIWVVSERDFKSYSKVLDLDQICYGPFLKKYSDLIIDKDLGSVVKDFRRRLQKERAHLFDTYVFKQESPFKSNLHFYLFDFRK